jgi:uncharacterized hydrophobic protein (TIGR00271 family)
MNVFPTREKLKAWLKVFQRPITRDRRREVVDQLTHDSSPGLDYFILVILSCVIATLGLLENSAAVIIGAMLVAPLMSPILGVSLASVTGRQSLFERASVALLEGALAAIGLSILVGLMGRAMPLTALGTLPAEVLARTRPTPFDLVIALAGGAAASYALAQPAVSAALPGVAIATALMPPLCTIGIGIAFGRWDVAGGALLLFLTNLTAIALAGIAVFAALGFRPLRAAETAQQVRSSLVTAAILVLVVTIPLTLLSLRFVGDTRLHSQVQTAVQEELAGRPGSQLVDIEIQETNPTLHLVVTLRSPTSLAYSEALAFQDALAVRLQRPVLLELVVIPAARLDPRIPPTQTPTATPGPSATPTGSPTVSRTPSPEPSLTPTPLPTSTSTPVLAMIASPGNGGVGLRMTPAGEVLDYLPNGAPIAILYNRETVNGVEWIQVRDVLGREGWVLSSVVVIRP